MKRFAFEVLCAGMFFSCSEQPSYKRSNPTEVQSSPQNASGSQNKSQGTSANEKNATTETTGPASSTNPSQAQGASTGTTTGFSMNDLAGTWRSGCLEVEPQIYAIAAFTFKADGTGMESLTQGYLDAACKNPANPALYPAGADPFAFTIGKALNDQRVTALTLKYTDKTGYTSFLIKGNQLTFSNIVEAESMVSATVDEAEIYIKQ